MNTTSGRLYRRAYLTRFRLVCQHVLLANWLRLSNPSEVEGNHNGFHQQIQQDDLSYTILVSLSTLVAGEWTPNVQSHGTTEQPQRSLLEWQHPDDEGGLN